MSVRALTWAWEQDVESSTKLVLLKLADNCNEDSGIAFPSLRTIARYTGLDRSTVIRHIQKLQTLGLIEIIQRAEGPVALPNWYRLKWKGGGRTMQPPVAQCDQGGGTLRLGVVAQCDPNRKIEPSINRKEEIPSVLDNAQFIEAFDEFKAYRKENKHPLGPVAAKRLLKTLSQRPNEAVKALGIAINRNWRGFMWEWIDNQQNGQKPKRPVENCI